MDVNDKVSDNLQSAERIGRFLALVNIAYNRYHDEKPCDRIFYAQKVRAMKDHTRREFNQIERMFAVWTGNDPYRDGLFKRSEELLGQRMPVPEKFSDYEQCAFFMGFNAEMMDERKRFETNKANKAKKDDEEKRKEGAEVD